MRNAKLALPAHERCEGEEATFFKAQLINSTLKHIAYRTPLADLDDTSLLLSWCDLIAWQYAGVVLSEASCTAGKTVTETSKQRSEPLPIQIAHQQPPCLSRLWRTSWTSSSQPSDRERCASLV